jgi:ribosomal protein S27AE
MTFATPDACADLYPQRFLKHWILKNVQTRYCSACEGLFVSDHDLEYWLCPRCKMDEEAFIEATLAYDPGELYDLNDVLDPPQNAVRRE